VRISCFVILLVTTFACCGATNNEISFRRTLRLEPQPGNPRNSEGDFIQLKDGRVLFIYTHFTGGSADDATAHLASRESRDGGLTWSTNDVVAVENEGGRNVMSVSLVRLQSGDIALFYLRKNSNSNCLPVVRFSRDEAKLWSPPKEVITNEVGYYVLNNARVVQLTSGRLVVPVAQHVRAGQRRQPGEILCYLSDDDGRSWSGNPQRLTATADGKTVDMMEPGVVEVSSNQLLMVIRTRLGCQYVSRSSDGGEHWSTPESSGLLSPESPATLTKLPGTNTLAIIWNDHAGQPLEFRTGRPPHRTPQGLALSYDGGKTWSKLKAIEIDPASGYCYTAARWVGDRLLLGYCAHRSAWGLQTIQLISIEREAIER
jgi:hypothetical protein